jgi:hypothetical protein
VDTVAVLIDTVGLPDTPSPLAIAMPVPAVIVRFVVTPLDVRTTTPLLPGSARPLPEAPSPKRVQVSVAVHPNIFNPAVASVSKKSSETTQVPGAEVPAFTGAVAVFDVKSIEVGKSLLANVLAPKAPALL